ncbi:MAG: hypothetical protein AAGL98_15675 [Planctomycetota bacterium]
MLWLLLLVGPIGWLGAKRLTTVEPLRRWLAIGLRGVVLIGLVLMLAGLRAERTHTDLTVIAVIQAPKISWSHWAMLRAATARAGRARSGIMATTEAANSLACTAFASIRHAIACLGGKP